MSDHGFMSDLPATPQDDTADLWCVDDFEDLYASVGDDLDQIPWAGLQPHPVLLSWLEEYPVVPAQSALVIACGLGDDAEELRRRGCRVRAFDYSRTAIGWCRRRFPDSTVEYSVADLLDLPDVWQQGFDLVVEINTIQSIPRARRHEAIAAIAGTVAPGGRLFVRCLARGDGESTPTRPWAVSRADLGTFASEGMREVRFEEGIGLSGRPCFQVVYARSPA